LRPMRSSLIALAALLLALAGCGGADLADETAGWSAQRLYGEAKDAMAAKEYAKAVKYFEKLEARYPYGRYAQQAQLEVAYAHWKDLERASAIAAAERFIKLYPNHDNVDYAYYLKGLINFTENEGLFAFLSDPDMAERDPKAAHEAFAAFREVVTRFPLSRYAADSAERMRYLVNALARHEVHVARYYVKRGAFLAAANPNLPRAVVADLVKHHVVTLKEVIDVQAAGDQTKAWKSVRTAAGHMAKIADPLAAAITKQFPQKFGA